MLYKSMRKTALKRRGKAMGKKQYKNSAAKWVLLHLWGAHPRCVEGTADGTFNLQKRGAGLLTIGSPTSVSGSHSASTLGFLARVGLWAQPGPAGELTAASWPQLGVSALSRQCTPTSAVDKEESCTSGFLLCWIFTKEEIVTLKLWGFSVFFFFRNRTFFPPHPSTNKI